MTILVTGVRGGIGGRVATLLAAAGRHVRGTTRTLDGPPAPGGVELVELDIDDPRTADAALTGVDTLFLYPTRGDCETFLAAARDHGVRHVVLLSSPAAFEAGEHDRLIGHIHRAAEDRVQRSGLPATIVYPSWLATNARRDWAAQIRERDHLALAYPDAQINPIHLDDVAEVVADLLTRDTHRARWHVLTGPAVLRVRDAVATVAETIGRPLRIDELDRAQALATRPPAMPEAVLEVLLDVAATAVDTPPLVTNAVERITGHPARSFADWVATHRESFLP
ncbi:NAD(P)H-binding protein [Nocardia sp. alder85J]|uniref:NAD(P)H-binding protein n=1 Tax=Nocardia sp. alder85J TaxID=2862949 RepID=UPI001CD23A8A|nr:NAD(P)H-binding protein [Nocardia sp. alder85J]MCX4090976.1 NAD(P)H-binding protein [Nocardia sp. alder85J]